MGRGGRRRDCRLPMVDFSVGSFDVSEETITRDHGLVRLQARRRLRLYLFSRERREKGKSCHRIHVVSTILTHVSGSVYTVV